MSKQDTEEPLTSILVVRGALEGRRGEPFESVRHAHQAWLAEQDVQGAVRQILADGSPSVEAAEVVTLRPWAPPFVIAAVVILGFSWLGLPEETALPRVEQMRPKGGAGSLELWTRQGSDVVRLEDGARVRPGDVIQIRYAVSAPRHVAIASFDSRAQVSLHWPENIEATALTQAGEAFSLPHGFELDATPGFEHFVMVVSEEAIDVRALLVALRSSGEARVDRVRELDANFLTIQTTLWKEE